MKTKLGILFGLYTVLTTWTLVFFVVGEITDNLTHQTIQVTIAGKSKMATKGRFKPYFLEFGLYGYDEKDEDPFTFLAEIDPDLWDLVDIGQDVELVLSADGTVKSMRRIKKDELENQ